MKKTNIGTNKISCTMNKIKKMMMITISTLNAKEDKFATNMMNFVEREVTSNNVIHNGENSWKTVKPLVTQTAIPVIRILMNNGTSAMIKSWLMKKDNSDIKSGTNGTNNIMNQINMMNNGMKKTNIIRI